MARIGMAASIVTAFGASICCIGQIVAVMFGSRCTSRCDRFFGVVTAALLGFAHTTYKRSECEPGSACSTQCINRIALWIATVVAFIVFTFPTWSGWILA